MRVRAKDAETARELVDKRIDGLRGWVDAAFQFGHGYEGEVAIDGRARLKIEETKEESDG